MIRVTVSYPAGEGAAFDHTYYHAQHRALLMERLASFGLQRVEMDRCLADGAGGPPPIVAAAHLVFTSLEGFQSGMAAHGRDIMADVARYTALRPDIVISEVA